MDGNCEYNRVTRNAFPSRYVQQDGIIHVETKDPGTYIMSTSGLCKPVVVEK